MDRFILYKESSVLLIVDIQERLAQVMGVKDAVIANNLHLIEAAQLLNVPVVVTEQYPKGLGPTVSEIKKALPSYKPIEKMTFDCCGERSFLDERTFQERKKVILTGMETHICVLQTAVGLLNRGYAVHLVSDAVCSRTKHNWKNALEYVRDAGGVITNTETVMFQLLKEAGTEAFKAISKRIK